MDYLENVIHHLSPFQLRALFLLSKAKNAIVSSSASSTKIGKNGKALGGVFSSLVRHKINGERLILPWGKSETGRGLRWKLNTKIINQQKLAQITKELLV